MKKILGNLNLDSDGIWGDVNDYGEQEGEKNLRQSVASKVYSD